MEPCARSAGTVRLTSPPTASASCSTGCSTSSSTATSMPSKRFDDYYDEVSEASSRSTARTRPAATLVRDAPSDGALPPPGRAHARSGQQPDAPRARVVSEELYPYYQDVYDHILRVSESTDALRDLVSTIVETNLSLRDYRQNQIMKKVSELGGDHRRAHPHHRLLRNERPLPWLRQDVGRRGLRRPDRRSVRRPLWAVPPPGLALSRRADTSSPTSTSLVVDRGTSGSTVPAGRERRWAILIRDRDAKSRSSLGPPGASCRSEEGVRVSFVIAGPLSARSARLITIRRGGEIIGVGQSRRDRRLRAVRGRPAPAR